ncbi:hypothetical protein NPS01_00480 [Nocardioides psychrotolerans]|uniref:Copper(I)-binding protein n=1 Tax=Nocardioides psychrotolerans TaxID=1005945 RepID=A0A1I3BY11_9ACTN|nr:hypothetical protein [Nocardioides psychrotolerans]GEP36385.1 hypothetical protein NPS01_00480 [Nocardioides psychrotolerans]SFH67194.1 Copper(I)-binding protein [Nocardioides psychrotolerans]
MHHHRKLALTVGALVLSAPVLTGCGFNYATNRVNTTTNATFNRDKAVDVVGAQVVAEGPGSGSLYARLVNNSPAGTELVSVAGSGDTVLTVSTIESFVLGAREGVNVENVGGGVRLTGDFIAGDHIPVALTFSNGDEVVLDVPVVRACGFYEGLDNAPPAEDTAGEGTAATETELYSCEAPEEHSE